MDKTNFTDLFEINTDTLDTDKSPDITLTLGGLNLRRWGPFVQINKGDSAKGMEQIEVTGLGEILGFFNGLFAVIDERDHFATLEHNLHTYKVEKASFHAHVGYRKIGVMSDGLEMGMWQELRFDGDFFKPGSFVNPAPYSQARTWETKAARDGNNMKHNIVNKHNGINYALKLLAGTAAVKFSIFSVPASWERGRESVDAKVMLFGQSAEARKAVKDAGADRKLFADGVNAVVNFASAAANAGAPVVMTAAAKAMTISVMDIEGEVSDLGAESLVGRTFNVLNNGMSLGLRKSASGVEAAVAMIVNARKLYGTNASLSEVLVLDD